MMSSWLSADAVLLAGGPDVIAYRVGVNRIFGGNPLSRNDLMPKPYSAVEPLFRDLLDPFILLAYLITFCIGSTS